jgi:HTH-type transcriptional regulator/antitoxin HigA
MINNEQAIALAQELEHIQNKTPEQEILLDLLVVLIEKFEGENYPIPQGKPHSTLWHLMQENNLQQEELVDIIGSKKISLEVIHGQQSISETQAVALAKLFNVDLELFM